LAAALVCATAAVSLAQQTSTSTETKTFEVLAVDGNHLIVKLPEGTKELTVPDDFRFTVDGQQLSVGQLKAGMKGAAAITTRTTVTPVTVTEVKNGTVMRAGGSSITVRTDQGIKMFTQNDIDKRGVKIVRNGKVAQIEDFRENDRLTATIVTTMPPRVVTEKEVNATLAKAAPPAPRPARVAPAPSPAATPAPAATAAPAPSPASEPAAPRLPKTGSSWPLLGLASVLLLAIGFSLTMKRSVVR
jgi:LPXTG-motif cell wall-anchored protein